MLTSKKHKVMLRLFFLFPLSLCPSLARAAEAITQEAGSNVYDVKTWVALSAALAIGLGVIGGTVAQGRTASVALEGIARNPGAAPRIQTPMILGLALIESLVLLSFVIAFLLQDKV